MAAVYDWAVCAADKAQWGWLLEVRTADRLKPGRLARARSRSGRMGESTGAGGIGPRPRRWRSEPVSLLLALGERLRATGGDAAPFLRRVQNDHPSDFWANLILGNATLQGAPQEAAGYYRAALASRPGTAVGYCAVGDALRFQHWPDQAIDYYEKALRLDPSYVRAYSNVGDALQDQGQLDEAIDYYREGAPARPRLCLGPPQPRQCPASEASAGRGLRSLPARDPA